MRLNHISGEYRAMYNTRRSRKKFNSSHSHRGHRSAPRGGSSRKILFLIGIVALFIVGRSFFSSGEEISAEATIEVRQGVLEFSLDGDDLWTRGSSGQTFLEGDSVRCTGNCEASIEIIDGGSVVVLAPNTNITFSELSQNSSGVKEITLDVETGELWGTIAENEFSNKKSHFLINTPSSEVSVKGAILNLSVETDDILRVSRGKTTLRAKNSSGERSDPLEVTIGQQILIDDAAKELFFTDDAAKAIEHIDPAFEESEWNLKNLELFSPQEAATIRHRIERSASPVEQDPSKNGLNSPTIESPLAGSIIPAAEDMLKLEGVAPLDAYRISVNGYILTKFQPGDRKWSYFASKKFGTLVPGKNTFSVISISRDGQESTPSTVEITYNATNDPVVVAESTSDFPVPVIRFPSLVDKTHAFPTNEPILSITGIVDPRTIAVEVNGFRLKKFQPGDTTWKYTANANYENMVIGENTYTVVAIGPGDEKSSTSIRVNYTPK